MTKKNILLLFTGGTIGSQVKQGSIDTDQSAGFKLLELFQQRYPEQAQIKFTTLQPAQILSENLHPSLWQTLIAVINAQDLSRYDGIIITHGTDTLAFTAAALGIYFHAIKIPLLLVSSNYPLDNPKANGLPNFICAVDFIRQRHAVGVFVPYQNPGQTMQVHIGTRLHSCLPLSGDFISVQSKPYCMYENAEFTPLHGLPEKQTSTISLSDKFARILLIKPYPGLDYSHFNLDNIDAILHDLYHSGTACVTSQWGELHSLIEFSAKCQQRGVPLYLAPAIKTADAYSSTRQLLAHGAKMVWNSSLETVYAKLSLAYACDANYNEIAAFLAANVAWEQVE